MGGISWWGEEWGKVSIVQMVDAASPYRSLYALKFLRYETFAFFAVWKTIHE